MGSHDPALRNAPMFESIVQESPIHEERQMKIICVGAGASGLCFAYKLQRSFTNFNLTIYEKNEQVAGTWFENRYPGYVGARAIESR